MNTNISADYKSLSSWATSHPVPVGWMTHFRYFNSLFAQLQDVTGDIVECGVGQGKSFAMLAYLIGSENHTPPRTLLGFDSFEGFPEPSVWDSSPRNPQKGEWKIEEQAVKDYLRESGINDRFPDLQIKIIGGFLGDSLPKVTDRSIALLHLDLDLYEGYRDGLHHLYPWVAHGGIIAFDEYGEKDKWPGCSKAIDEYFSGLSEKIRLHPETGKYYIIKGQTH